MEFTGLGLKVSVKRDRPVQTFGLEEPDLQVIGQQTLDYIRALSREEICRRVDSVSVDSLEDQDLARSKLADHGILIVRDYVDVGALHDVDREIARISDRANAFAAGGDNFREDPDCVYQSGAGQLTTYRALASHEKSVITIRGGADKGMVDVFNVDRLAPMFAGAIRDGFEAPNLLRILADGMAPRNLNVYINSGIQSTRGFHVDSYSQQVKAFLYLTDVLELDNGPYVYVRGQHRDSVFRRINRTLAQTLSSKTEAPVVPREDIVPVIAPKGSLVISDQGGIHRGFPQAPQGRRCVAVMNYA